MWLAEGSKGSAQGDAVAFTGIGILGCTIPSGGLPEAKALTSGFRVVEAVFRADKEGSVLDEGAAAVTVTKTKIVDVDKPVSTHCDVTSPKRRTWSKVMTRMFVLPRIFTNIGRL